MDFFLIEHTLFLTFVSMFKQFYAMFRKSHRPYAISSYATLTST